MLEDGGGREGAARGCGGHYFCSATSNESLPGQEPPGVLPRPLSRASSPKPGLWLCPRLCVQESAELPQLHAVPFREPSLAPALSSPAFYLVLSCPSALGTIPPMLWLRVVWQPPPPLPSHTTLPSWLARVLCSHSSLSYPQCLPSRHCLHIPDPGTLVRAWCVPALLS